MIALHKKGEWLEGTLDKRYAGIPLGQLLREQWKWPKKTVHLLFQRKELLVDGQPVSQLAAGAAGQKLAARLLAPEELGIEPVQGDLAVLYEDDHLLIVNKPAHLLVHPTEPEHRLTLDHLVAGYFAANGIESKVRHIHRLDQDTSGAVLYAKHALAGAFLDEALRVRKVKRTYFAYVHGKLKQKAGTIDKPLGKDRHNPARRRVTPGGEAAVTHYRLIEQYAQAAKLSCQLDTGRTHQIRVHLSELGHPLIGDTLYGGKATGLERQALHAASLSLIHPFGGATVQADAPMPKELIELEKVLQNARA
ncbi:RluA family pseudouridine synthase [Brevibacillus fluminis]|uniref:RluA family pseudouridine synthase n=1 Tax=Brevibacillus fluminis TaxID=511487 RepID=UPI003F8AB24B